MNVHLQGIVVSGARRAAGFTHLEAVRAQFLSRLGIDPHPGTLNLIPRDDRSYRAWLEIREAPGIPIDNPASGGCAAVCYPVRIANLTPAAIVVPQMADYPADKIELLAAVGLREHLALRDGSAVELEVYAPLRPRGLLFDVDGTLVDSVDALWKLTVKATESFGIEVPLATVRHVLNINHHRFWDLVVPQDYPDRTALFARLDAEARRHWHAVLDAEAEVFPGLRETLERLRGAGIRLGIVTASRGESIRLLEAEGLIDLFEVIVTANDVAQRKPHPEGLLQGAEKLNLAPAELAYVGDTIVDVRAARAAGMAAVGVLTGAGTSADLTAEGADRLAHSHPRILDLIALG